MLFRSDTKSVLSEIFTTHTFAFEENWGTGNRYPYKDILFTDKALLSQNHRDENNKFELDEPKKSFGEAFSLKFFVYAYLGIHDHFYSRTKTEKKGVRIAVPAYGAFLTNDLDNMPKTNATSRDLSSPEIVGINKEDLFLKPSDARIYTAYEISNRHNNNFWKYWGDLDSYRNEKDYLKDNWQWKTEFHYFDKVEINKFTALLWPIKTVFTSKDVSGLNPKTISEIETFKTENPNVVIYQYEWDLSNSFFRFAWASYIVTHYFYQKRVLPSEMYFYKKFHSEFLD